MTISVDYRTIELKFEAENVNLIHLRRAISWTVQISVLGVNFKQVNFQLIDDIINNFFKLLKNDPGYEFHDF